MGNVAKDSLEDMKKKALTDIVQAMDIRLSIHFEPLGKRGGKFEMDETLNRLISSGEGINFTLFNPMIQVMSHQVYAEETSID